MRPRVLQTEMVQSGRRRRQYHHRGRRFEARRFTVAQIARERIEILLDLARKKTVAGDERLARRYVALARKISSRTKVRIPAGEKRYLCKNCDMPLLMGRNARVRLAPDNPMIIITCLSCGQVKRFPYDKRPTGTR